MNKKALSFTSKNVDTVIKEGGYDFPLDHAMAAAWLMAHFKGINIKVIEIKELSSIADYFVIGSVSNIVQAKSISEEITFQLKRHNAKVLSAEGSNHSEWMLLDFGDIMIHIFQDNVRDIFDIDQLWQDAPRIKIPSEFYQSSIQTPIAEADTSADDHDEDEDGYF